MKNLIVYYSRTGVTKKIAQSLQEKLGYQIDEITDTKNRKGIFGWLSAGRDAGLKKTTEIAGVEAIPSEYNIVVIGSPTWNSSVSTPIRTYIEDHKEDLKHVAVFSTGKSSDIDAVNEMKNILGKRVFAEMHIVRGEDFEDQEYMRKIESFVNRINSFTQ